MPMRCTPSALAGCPHMLHLVRDVVHQRRVRLWSATWRTTRLRLRWCFLRSRVPRQLFSEREEFRRSWNILSQWRWYIDALKRLAKRPRPSETTYIWSLVVFQHATKSSFCRTERRVQGMYVGLSSIDLSFLDSISNL
jgi:hypothetical protein